MKRLIIFAVALACTACSPVAVKISPSDVANARLVPISDMRPASEREQKIFSLLITSKEYGIIRAGDGKFTPPPIALLQDQIYRKFRMQDHLPKVIVYHFVVYINDAVALRRGATAALCGAACGLIPGLLINQSGNPEMPGQVGLVNENIFNDLSSDEYRRGLYSADEDTSGLGGVYIVYIETDIDGRKLFTRTAVPAVKDSGREGLPKAVERAIGDHLAHYGAPGGSPWRPGPNISRSAPQAESHGDVVSAAESTTGTSVPTVQAQAVASQMGCGVVQASGGSTFVASCGSYAVLIGCDGDQCRPLHTVRSADNH